MSSRIFGEASKKFCDLFMGPRVKTVVRYGKKYTIERVSPEKATALALENFKKNLEAAAKSAQAKEN